MSWGKGILLSFIFFAAFIITLVVVCVRQDVTLVSKEYYQEEIAYQQQIERMNNAAMLEKRPIISVTESFVQIDYGNFKQLEKGKLDLFCPSNMDFDKSFELRKMPSQKFMVGNLKKGLYRARLLWTMDGKEFFIEQVITI
jgi:hypothetical protein